ncbi:hypothetical protein HN51_040789 [Arachis hypogaea]
MIGVFPSRLVFTAAIIPRTSLVILSSVGRRLGTLRRRRLAAGHPHACVDLCRTILIFERRIFFVLSMVCRQGIQHHRSLCLIATLLFVPLLDYKRTPYQTQESKLRRGVDIVVGTPGRMKDHIERKNIDLSQLKFRVLDEANEMLRMGFVEDVELILGKVQDVSKIQTLLFSVTLPDWVKHACFVIILCFSVTLLAIFWVKNLAMIQKRVQPKNSTPN